MRATIKTLMLNRNTFSILIGHRDLLDALSEGRSKFCDIMSRNIVLVSMHKWNYSRVESQHLMQTGMHAFFCD